jgi:adenine-specific DNA glycosylase
VEARSADLLAWYDRHRRVLPWRAAAGERPDPYRVWLSEIMLQQTTIKAVVAILRAVHCALAERARTRSGIAR